MKFAAPLGAFLVLSVFLTAGLRLDPHLVPSPLIDKPAPAFRLAQLHDPDKTFAPVEMQGRVWLLNVWASWCVSCREEHALLTALSRTGLVPIYGLAYKDNRDNALEFLGALGNPYVLAIQDTEGRVGIDYGVYGVPESYLIDKTGVIRFKQIGPITADVLEKTILPMVGILEPVKRVVLSLAVALHIIITGVTAHAGPEDADAELEKRVQAFSQQMRCLVCQNETLADSRAELAVDLRREIREQMKAGRSDEQITAFLTDRYGDFVLYRPPLKPSTYPLWFGPFVLLVAGLLALYRRLKRWPTPPDVRPLSAGERKRARQLLEAGPQEETGPPRARVAGTSTITGANVAVYRRQLAEMESDLRHHIITNEQFFQDREELEQRLIADLR